MFVSIFMVVLGMVVGEEWLYIFIENYFLYNGLILGKDFVYVEDDIIGICIDMVKVMLDWVDYDYVMKMWVWSYVYDWV